MTYRTTLSAIALASASLSAYADTAAVHVGLSHFSLFAVDLVPSDNLSPSFEVLAGTGLTFAQVSSNSNTVDKEAPGLFSPMTLSSNAKPGQNISVAVNSSGFDMDITANSAQSFFLNAAFGTRLYSVPLSIRVAPGTSIVASGSAALSATCTSQGQNTCDARGSMEIFFQDKPSGGTIGTFSSPQVSATGLFGLPGSYSAPVGASFSNFSDHYIDLNLLISGYASAQSSYSYPETSVPEPSAYGLLLGGLLTVGAIAARGRGRGRAEPQSA